MEKNKNVKEITIKIEGKEWEDALDKAFEKANKKPRPNGCFPFNPGFVFSFYPFFIRIFICGNTPRFLL